MKRALQLLLLFGAILGLFAQQAAYAAGAHSAFAPPAVTRMSADCMEMMQGQPSQPAHKPCKGMTPDCVGVAGCVVPIIVGEPAAVAAEPIVVQLAFWPADQILVGIDPPPDQHPPAIPG